MRLTIFERPWEVEWIDFLIGVERDIEIGASDRIDECLVLILRIEDDHIRSHHQSPEDLEFHGE